VIATTSFNPMSLKPGIKVEFQQKISSRTADPDLSTIIASSIIS
jgi:hypothetical protein